MVIDAWQRITGQVSEQLLQVLANVSCKIIAATNWLNCETCPRSAGIFFLPARRPEFMWKLRETDRCCFDTWPKHIHKNAQSKNKNQNRFLNHLHHLLYQQLVDAFLFSVSLPARGTKSRVQRISEWCRYALLHRPPGSKCCPLIGAQMLHFQ